MPHVENLISQHLPQQPSGQCWCCPGRLVALEPYGSGEGGTSWHWPRVVWGGFAVKVGTVISGTAANARAKPSWRAGEGLLQPHPLQTLLIKELIWSMLLCVSFVFRGATAGGASSSVQCRQADRECGIDIRPEQQALPEA